MKKAKKPRNTDEEKAIAQRQWMAREKAELEWIRRSVCTTYKFWHVCPQKACGRAHACTGDAFACFDRWWPIVPEDLKIQLNVAIKARHDGMSPKEAVRRGTEEAALWRAQQAAKGEAAQGGAVANAAAPPAPIYQPAPVSASAPPMPRVRAI